MKPSNSQPNTNKENNNSSDSLDNYFSAFKNETYSDSFPAIENWLRSKSSKIYKLNPERRITRMKNYILLHKMRLVYTVIALAIIIGACSLPVTQNETIGHVISWTIPAGSSTTQVDLLPWVNKSNLSVSENTNNSKTDNIYTLMLPGSTNEQVQSYSRDLEKIKEITTIKIFPLNENVKRPVYSAALNSFFRININATKMSDEELTKEIEKQLKEQGIEIGTIDFKTDGYGKRQIQMKLDKNDKTPKDFELRINDGNNEEVLKHKVKINGDADRFKNKTDDEIKQMIKKDIDNPNIKDSDIKISHDEKGNVQVKVDVEDKK